MMRKNVFLVVIIATFSFISLFSIFLYWAYFNLSNYFPYPLSEVPFDNQFLFAVFLCISTAIFVSALGLHLDLNTFLISIDSIDLLQKSYQSEINALKMQMNPHFISNALNNLTEIVRNQDKKEAQDYNQSLILLLSEQLRYTRTTATNLKDELSWLEQYLKMEQKRLHFSFSYTIIVEDEALYQNLIPPMLLQPLVENSIHHGFNPEKFKGNGQLEIRISKLFFKNFKISIRDNGLGTSAFSESESKKRQSISTKSIQDRIKLLNETGRIYISLQANQTSQGSVSEIYLRRKLL